MSSEVLQQFLGRRETLATVRVTGNPIAYVGPWGEHGVRVYSGSESAQDGVARTADAGQARHERQRRQRSYSGNSESGGGGGLFVGALGAAAGARGAHQLLSILHADLAISAVRVAAYGHQGGATGRRFHPGVGHVRRQRRGRRVAGLQRVTALSGDARWVRRVRGGGVDGHMTHHLGTSGTVRQGTQNTTGRKSGDQLARLVAQGQVGT